MPHEEAKTEAMIYKHYIVLL